MGCPLCLGDILPPDTNRVEKNGKRVLVQGKVYAIIPANYTYSPYANYATVSLYPRKGPVKYLKFKTNGELERWHFERDKSYVVDGCFHIVNGKELIFDISSVRLIIN